ncbi:hypothetical protein EPN44_08885 [bacterium]|nr:MAG: hypothetical protein EPN44_08885 [bacterium]
MGSAISPRRRCSPTPRSTSSTCAQSTISASSVSDETGAYDYLFLPVGLNVRERRCVVIGDDAEAREKGAALQAAGAEVAYLRHPSQVGEQMVADAFVVISTPQDETLSSRLLAYAERHKFLLCCIDQPAYSTVAMQAIVESGPVRVAISTGSVSPTVAATLQRALARALDARFARFMLRLQALRRRVRRSDAGPTLRRRHMREAAAEFTVEVSVRYPAWFEKEESGQGPR